MIADLHTTKSVFWNLANELSFFLYPYFWFERVHDSNFPFFANAEQCIMKRLAETAEATAHDRKKLQPILPPSVSLPTVSVSDLVSVVFKEINSCFLN